MDIGHLKLTARERSSCLSDPRAPLVHRTLWRLLDEFDVRIGELLAMKIPDVALDSGLLRFAEAKYGPKEISITSEAAADLAQLIGARTSGPVFVGEDGIRLSEEAAFAVFRGATGKPLHALRTGWLERELLVRHEPPSH